MKRIDLIVGAAFAASALAMATSALAQAPAAPKAPAVSPALEACIRTNADVVERGVEGLSDAVSFLVSKVCATETRDAMIAEKKAQFEQSLAEQKKYLEEACNVQRAQPAKKQAPPARGVPPAPEPYAAAVEADFCAELEGLNASVQNPMYAAAMADPMMLGWGYPGMEPPAPAEATALAARLLVERRATRTRR